MRIAGRTGEWYVRVKATKGCAVPVWARIAGPYRTRCEARYVGGHVYCCLVEARIDWDGRLVLDWRANPYLSPRVLPGIKESIPGGI
jgi:hypothetical protein